MIPFFFIILLVTSVSYMQDKLYMQLVFFVIRGRSFRVMDLGCCLDQWIWAIILIILINNILQARIMRITINLDQ